VRVGLQRALFGSDSRHVAINRFDPTDSPTDTASITPRSSPGLRALIAYASNGFVYTVRTNRTGRHRVMPAADVFALQWSGDGTLLGYQGSSRLGYGPVFVVAPDGRHRRRLTRGDTSWSWSPRGRALALNRELIDFATRRRWRALPRTITRVRTIVWSPNGRTIAYVINTGIYVVDSTARRGHLIRWPIDRPTSDPAWSHDSRTLAFATPRGLFEVSADGRRRGYVPLDWCKAASGG